MNIDLSQLITAEAKAAAAKERLVADIAARRYQAEVSGVVWQGYGIATDRDSRNLVAQERSAALNGLRGDGDGWKCLDLSTGAVTFWDASNAELIEMADAVYSYVRDCFKREKELLAAVEAGTYTADMLEQGWP